MAQPTDARYANIFEELTARSVAEQVRTAQRYRELLEQVANGHLDPAALRAEHERLLAEHQAQMARDITELGVRYYESLLDLNRAYVDRLFDQLAAAARTTQDATAAPPQQPPETVAIDVPLRGRPGELAEASFAVENNRNETAEVVFYASEFTGETGEPFRTPLELDPPRLLLAPHTEHPVRLRIRLDPDRFLSGNRYRAQLLVRGAEQLELRIVIDVDAEDGPPDEAGGAPGSEPASEGGEA
jgi:hypothetical protein